MSQDGQDPRKTQWERRYEIALKLFIQTVASLLGLWIMFRAISSATDRPWLYFAAMGMMGLPAARSFGKVIGFLGDLLDAFKAAKQTEDESERRSAEQDRQNDDA